MNDPAILTLATVEAPHAALQSDVEAAVRERFAHGAAGFDVEELAAVFRRAGIERRTFALPLEEYVGTAGDRVAEAPLSNDNRNDRFLEVAGGMLLRAAEEAVPPHLRSAVTHVVTITTSGVATPSLECAVIDRLDIARSARRVPVFGLGCAGGTSGLQIASDLAASSEDALVLVLCVELTSLTYLASDVSQRNFVACALFGDGAAAALVGPAALAGEDGPLATLGAQTTRMVPDSRDLMGWDVRAEGWEVVFSPRIPAVVRREARGLVESVASRPELAHWILHPGGRKILEAYGTALELDGTQLAAATETLRAHGNMSAATVLFVLDRVLRERNLEPGPAVATAFGPGFSAEAIALDLHRPKR
ncbi:MAG: 3-oxoacyl-[acyl-carrier-protein] synthase III C-terminal domain-containing protein [Planctomycetota bacterium]